MNPKTLLAAISGALILAPSLASADSALIAKQLAGPPAEFAAMAPANPAQSAIHSKSALLPLDFTADKRGTANWTGLLPVENGRARFLLFSDSPDTAQISLRGPNGQQVEHAKSLARDTRRAQFGLELSRYPADYYAFDNLVEGDWQIDIRAKQGEAPAFLLIEGDARSELASYPAHRKHRVGETQQIVALLTYSEDDAAPRLAHAAGEIKQATLRVTDPRGNVQHYLLTDDGLHGDGLAGDGVYGASFKADLAGEYIAQVQVHALSPTGQTLLRTAEHLVPVVGDRLQLDAGRIAASRNKDGRLAIALPVSGNKQHGHYRVYAEVWGSNAKGQATPVAWIGGMSEVGAEGLSVSLDERWIAKAAAQAPFSLRNLRVEEPQHFVSVLQRDRIDLDLGIGQIKAKPGLAIDETMLMGARPSQLADLQKNTGSRLLLVHGYCSGDVWPAGHFSNASKFLDLNQNRSHDEFARRIQSFGNSWNSFGVVAHSQGGAASLHLYTYYWSGLDRAGAGRLIQSVGTPYQGTNLAGILASLGSWFGVGCGTNSNLSYSGASAWLSGIPTWARSKVNYYTTSFRSTNWWTNDYCNFATDLVLSDPEDGTTEQTYGQLPGALNRGHTTGQCHTTNMRDPAQYLDGSRNGVMNSNAAR